jgi:hypothetical protein
MCWREHHAIYCGRALHVGDYLGGLDSQPFRLRSSVNEELSLIKCNPIELLRRREETEIEIWARLFGQASDRQGRDYGAVPCIEGAPHRDRASTLPERSRYQPTVWRIYQPVGAREIAVPTSAHIQDFHMTTHWRSHHTQATQILCGSCSRVAPMSTYQLVQMATH